MKKDFLHGRSIQSFDYKELFYSRFSLQSFHPHIIHVQCVHSYDVVCLCTFSLYKIFIIIHSLDTCTCMYKNITTSVIKGIIPLKNSP